MKRFAFFDRGKFGTVRPKVMAGRVLCADKPLFINATMTNKKERGILE